MGGEDEEFVSVWSFLVLSCFNINCVCLCAHFQFSCHDLCSSGLCFYKNKKLLYHVNFHVTVNSVMRTLQLLS